MFCWSGATALHHEIEAVERRPPAERRSRYGRRFQRFEWRGAHWNNGRHRRARFQVENGKPRKRAVFDVRLSGKTAQITDEEEKRKYIAQQWGTVEGLTTLRRTASVPYSVRSVEMRGPPWNRTGSRRARPAQRGRP